MAASSTFPLPDDDLLACSVCLEAFDLAARLPKVLPCGHTFCLTCLEALTRSSVEGATCPNCRGVIALPHGGGAKDIATNMFARNMVGRAQTSGIVILDAKGQKCSKGKTGGNGSAGPDEARVEITLGEINELHLDKCRRADMTNKSVVAAHNIIRGENGISTHDKYELLVKTKRSAGIVSVNRVIRLNFKAPNRSATSVFFMPNDKIAHQDGHSTIISSADLQDSKKYDANYGNLIGTLKPDRLVYHKFMGPISMRSVDFGFRKVLELIPPDSVSWVKYVSVCQKEQSGEIAVWGRGQDTSGVLCIYDSYGSILQTVRPGIKVQFDNSMTCTSDHIYIVSDFTLTAISWSDVQSPCVNFDLRRLTIYDKICVIRAVTEDTLMLAGGDDGKDDEVHVSKDGDKYSDDDADKQIIERLFVLKIHTRDRKMQDAVNMEKPSRLNEKKLTHDVSTQKDNNCVRKKLPKKQTQDTGTQKDVDFNEAM